MPNYPWFEKNRIDADSMDTHMEALRMVGVPYTDADINGAAANVQGKTEMQAMVAYLQVLGTMVDLKEGVDYRE